MAVKIRCSECGKKISVDAAFAGSMCRCPYCKSIVVVPKGIASGTGQQARPSRPSGRPGRPAKPSRQSQTGSGLSGSGLRDSGSSRPLLSAADAQKKRKKTRTVIEKPGTPQVPGGKKKRVVKKRIVRKKAVSSKDQKAISGAEEERKPKKKVKVIKVKKVPGGTTADMSAEKSGKKKVKRIVRRIKKVRKASPAEKRHEEVTAVESGAVSAEAKAAEERLKAMEERIRAAEEKVKAAENKFGAAEKKAADEAEKRRQAEEREQRARKRIEKEKAKIKEEEAERLRLEKQKAEAASKKELAEQRKLIEEQMKVAEKRIRAAEHRLLEETKKVEEAGQRIQEAEKDAEEERKKAAQEKANVAKEKELLAEEEEAGKAVAGGAAPGFADDEALLLERVAAEAAREEEEETAAGEAEEEEEYTSESTDVLDGDDANETGYDFIDEETATYVSEEDRKATALEDLASSTASSTIEAVSVDPSELSQEEIDSIPMANPVRFQGIVTLVAIVSLLVLIPVTVLLAVKLWSPREEDGGGVYIAPTRQVHNPFKTYETPSIARRPLKSPVIYCLDAGGSMRGGYLSWCAEVIRASAASLGAGDTFGVIVARETGNTLVGGTLHGSGAEGAAAALKGVADLRARGMSYPSRAVMEALKHNPQSVVVIVKKPFREMSAEEIGRAAKEAGAEIIVFAIDPPAVDLENYVALVKAAGGSKEHNILEYTDTELSRFFDEQ